MLASTRRIIAKESGKQNIIWDAFGWDYTGTQTMSSKATCASAYIIGYLEGNNDPRISNIYEEPADWSSWRSSGLA